MALLGEEDFDDEFPVLPDVPGGSLLEEAQFGLLDLHDDGGQEGLLLREEDGVGDVEVEAAVETDFELARGGRAFVGVEDLAAALLVVDEDLGVGEGVLVVVGLLGVVNIVIFVLGILAAGRRVGVLFERQLDRLLYLFPGKYFQVFNFYFHLNIIFARPLGV